MKDQRKKQALEASQLGETQMVDFLMISGKSTDHELQLQWGHRPRRGHWAVHINTHPGCNRTLDPDMALGGSKAHDINMASVRGTDCEHPLGC